MLSIIHAMYENAKSCGRVLNYQNIFKVMLVYAKTKNLSPVLFSLFLNDLVQFISMSYDGLSDVYNATHFVLDMEEIAVYLRLYLLLYMLMTRLYLLNLRRNYKQL